MVWCIKAIYSSGGHYVTDKSGNKLRFNDKQEATNLAEVITAENRKSNSPNITSYIVVEEIV